MKIWRGGGGELILDKVSKFKVAEMVRAAREALDGPFQYVFWNPTARVLTIVFYFFVQVPAVLFLGFWIFFQSVAIGADFFAVVFFSADFLVACFAGAFRAFSSLT